MRHTHSIDELSTEEVARPPTTSTWSSWRHRRVTWHVECRTVNMSRTINRSMNISDESLFFSVLRAIIQQRQNILYEILWILLLLLLLYACSTLVENCQRRVSFRSEVCVRKSTAQRRCTFLGDVRKKNSYSKAWCYRMHIKLTSARFSQSHARQQWCRRLSQSVTMSSSSCQHRSPLRKSTAAIARPRALWSPPTQRATVLAVELRDSPILFDSNWRGTEQLSQFTVAYAEH